MSTKLHFLLVLLLPFGNIFSQPAADTLRFSMGQVDTLLTDTVDCYPYRCPNSKKCHVWQLPLNMHGFLEVGAFPANLYEIIFITGNDTVRYDCCDSLFPVAQSVLKLFFDFGPNTQVMICGPDSAQIFMAAKFDTTNNYKPLMEMPPLVELDTLCGTLKYTEPILGTQYYYKESEIRTAGVGGKMPTPVKSCDRIPNVGYIRAGRIYEH